MSTLPDELFSLVERLILAAREAAETAAEAAINNLAVNRPEPYSSMDEPARKMRRTLRAKARQLGGGSQTEGLQPLIEEMAYQQWHRMLFARFLAENNLLMHPSGVAVSLEDCAELATEENEADAWAVAAKYASSMLPGIFRNDDPVVFVRFAPEGQFQLERILDDLPEIAFTSDDSLGWMYQFWQSKKKAEVNASERKIGGADLAPVTQLFTENYMVRFLLENSLGAWWAGKHPDSPLLKKYKYLRYESGGAPAAGVFEGWPQTASEVKIMDPCCGSGHFLIAAFEMMQEMRMSEEGLDEREAGDAVLRDNLYGLELDLRATQIASFSVALAAWKSGQYRELPALNFACSGNPVQGSLGSWLKLAGKDERLKTALKNLYQLFEKASTLGSLINPKLIEKGAPLFTAQFDELEPLLEPLLSQEIAEGDSDGNIFRTLALNSVQVARFLTNTYSLVITNVPYLSRGKQSTLLQQYCDDFHPTSKNDLAFAFIDRIVDLSGPNQSFAVVSPQSWQYLETYTKYREIQLTKTNIEFIANLGTRSFQTPMYDSNVSLAIVSKHLPSKSNQISYIDASAPLTITEKIEFLISSNVYFVDQSSQIENPGLRIVLSDSVLKDIPYLSEYAHSFQGISSGDNPRYRRFFWEINQPNNGWRYLQSTVKENIFFGGKEHLLFYEELIDPVKPGSYIRGQSAWGKKGVVISQMGNLPCTLSTGALFDTNAALLLPNKESDLIYIWTFCSSEIYNEEVRKIDKSVKVTNATLAKVPFDLDRWKKITEEKYPNGLPEPYSNDPTQWLFKGDLTDSTEPLQVAISRLLGYFWPEQEQKNIDGIVDDDGIVPLVSAGREIPAADRLREFLATTYGDEWSVGKQALLLASVGFGGKSLEDWLRDGFFQQHVKLFKNRPFIWHIWDGRKDGFHALVNYHKLDTAALDRLIYTYLGSWIELQRGQRDIGEPGADGRLVAALELKEKLEVIREGQPPYDIFVRWKSLGEQLIGWNPDLNDGVRLNIRPFVTAGVLRNKFTVHWKKDRGKNPDGSERLNDLHYTNEEKLATR